MGKKQKATPSRPAAAPTAPGWSVWIVRTALGLAGLLALWALGKMFGPGTVDGWGDYGPVIVRNQIVALWHGAVLLAAAAGFIHHMTRPSAKGSAHVAAWILAAVVALDALWLSRHYVQTMGDDAVRENEVIRLLKSDGPRHRVALLTHEGFYNAWLTYLLPYHAIQTVNITQMPRMPAEYQNYLGALSRQPLRHWRLAAVGYVLAPVQIWHQIRGDRRMGDVFDVAMTYDVAPAENGVRVVATPSGQHVVLRLKEPGPRVSLAGAWRAASDEESLTLLTSPEHPLFDVALVAPEHADGLPAPGEPGPAGSVEIRNYRVGRMELAVRADRPAVLRVADKYDPRWRATVNGRPAPLLRVDYLFRGLLLEPGEHDVVFEYRPPVGTLWLLACGLALCGAAALSLLIRRSPAPQGVSGS